MVLFIQSDTKDNDEGSGHSLIGLIRAVIFSFGLIVGGPYLAVQMNNRDKVGFCRSSYKEIRTEDMMKKRYDSSETNLNSKREQKIIKKLEWIKEVAYGIAGLIREVWRKPSILVCLLANFR